MTIFERRSLFTEQRQQCSPPNNIDKVVWLLLPRALKHAQYDSAFGSWIVEYMCPSSGENDDTAAISISDAFMKERFTAVGYLYLRLQSVLVEEDANIPQNMKLQNCDVPDFFWKSIVEDPGHRPISVRPRVHAYEAMFHLIDHDGGPTRTIVYPLSLNPAGAKNSVWSNLIPPATRAACNKEYRQMCIDERTMWPRHKPNHWVQYFSGVNIRLCLLKWNKLPSDAASKLLTAPTLKHFGDESLSFNQTFRSFAASMIKALVLAMVYKGGRLAVLATEIQRLGIHLKPNFEMCKNVNNLLNRILNRHGFSLATCCPEDCFWLGGSCEMPMIVKLKDVPNCFAVCNSVIFEPGLAVSLPCRKESLDFLCGGEGLYRGAAWARIVVATQEADNAGASRKGRRIGGKG